MYLPNETEVEEFVAKNSTGEYLESFAKFVNALAQNKTIQRGVEANAVKIELGFQPAERVILAVLAMGYALRDELESKIHGQVSVNAQEKSAKTSFGNLAGQNAPRPGCI
jgi:hypothetical protein